MNTRNKTIKEILSLYDTILENKNVNEASDIYDNVDFKDGVVGNSRPTSDNINLALLQDIETAAKNAGVKVDITTAITGHKKGTRHETGNAVDIAIINGKPVNISNKTNVDKLVDALIDMGYVKNKEDSSTPKSVLTFGFSGHDNHVHISNTNQSPSKDTDTTTDTGVTTDTEPSSFARDIGRSLLQSIGIKESLDYNSLGKKIIVRSGEAIIPKENNSSIKSPVSGVVSNYLNDCDGLTIEFGDENKKLYLNYCGISTKNFRYGQKLTKGDVIGYPESDSDVRVTLYNSRGRKEYIGSNKKSGSNSGLFSLFKTKDKPENTSKDYNKTTDYSQYNSETGKALIQLKDKLFSSNKKDKLEENIDRIKNLL
jgi:hypothetical protein